MFVSDYRPTKRVGVEELDGAVRLFGQAVERLRAEGVAGVGWYEGAWLALVLLRDGKYEYPADFLAVFGNKCDEIFG
jgi:hypothetical protein